MTQTKTEKLKDVFEEASAFTLAALFLLVLAGATFAIFIWSLRLFGWLLGPVVPEGWPSIIILAVALLPPLFFGGIVVSFLGLGPQGDDDG